MAASTDKQQRGAAWKLKLLGVVMAVALAARWTAGGNLPEIPGVNAFIGVADHIVIWAILIYMLYLPLRLLFGAVLRRSERLDD